MSDVGADDAAEDLRAENAALRAEVAQIRKQLDAALKVIAELREQAGQNSQNSSRAPSTDPRTARDARPKKKSDRKPGGQPGHKGHGRMLLPVDDENVRDVKPDRCKGCGSKLEGEDQNPYRHQVVEVPVPKPEVREARLHELECRCCGTRTRAELPADFPRGGFGPRLVVTIALLSGKFRLSKRLTACLLACLYDIPISVGSVVKCEQVASEALNTPVQQARDYVKEQTVKHADESGWAEGPSRSKAWLWVATTAFVTVFLIHPKRGTAVAKRLLGLVRGILVSDRWCAYEWWPLKKRQLCWSHIKRHFKKMSEAGGAAKDIGEALLVQERHLFKLWRRVRDGTLERSSFQTYASEIRCRVRELLERGQTCSHKFTATTCGELLRMEVAMWTFVRVEGVEPTNNPGERAIRPGVIWRKLCFGTHSTWGSRFVERMLSVVHTLALQDRDVHNFLLECVTAHLAGQPVTASLLPQAA